MPGLAVRAQLVLFVLLVLLGLAPGVSVRAGTQQDLRGFVAAIPGLSDPDQPGTLAQQQALFLSHKLIREGYFHRRDLERGVAGLQALLNASPNWPTAYVALSDLYIQVAYINEDDYRRSYLELARKSIRTALRIDPRYANAVYHLGMVDEYEGHYDAALRDYRRAIALGCDSTFIGMRELLTQARTGRDLDGVARRMLRLRDAHPGDAQIRNELDLAMARIAAQQHRWRDATDLYEYEIRMSPIGSTRSSAMQYAYAHSNFAGYLLCARDDPVHSLQEDDTALGVARYGMAVSLAASAYYAQFAHAVIAQRAMTSAARDDYRHGHALAGTDALQAVAQSCGREAAVYLDVVRARELLGGQFPRSSTDPQGAASAHVGQR